MTARETTSAVSGVRCNIIHMHGIKPYAYGGLARRLYDMVLSNGREVDSQPVLNYHTLSVHVGCIRPFPLLVV